MLEFSWVYFSLFWPHLLCSKAECLFLVIGASNATLVDGEVLDNNKDIALIISMLSICELPRSVTLVLGEVEQ